MSSIVSDRISSFFSTFRSKATTVTYSWALRHFFNEVYGQGDFSQQVDQYFSDVTRDHEKDIQKFFAGLSTKAPLTTQMAMSCVRSFLRHNHVELPEYLWKSLNRRRHGTGAATMDRAPSASELRTIMNYMPLQGRALVMVLASSGMRIGETLKVRVDDVDLTVAPVRINIRREYTKSGNPRTAFISSEAKEVVEQWIRGRQQYLQTASKKSRQSKSTVDDRLFPFGKVTAQVIWNTAIRRAGLNKRDVSTNREELHIHSLRKFFISQISKVTTEQIAETLVGHQGYLSNSYRRLSVDELAEEYKKLESSIRIFVTVISEDTGNIRRELFEKTNALETVVKNLSNENQRLKDDVEFLQMFLGKEYQDYQNELKDDKEYQQKKRELNKKIRP